MRIEMAMAMTFGMTTTLILFPLANAIYSHSYVERVSGQPGSNTPVQTIIPTTIWRTELMKNWSLIHLTRLPVDSGVSSLSHMNHCHDTTNGNRESKRYAMPFPGT